MAKKMSMNYQRAVKCIDQHFDFLNKITLTPIERAFYTNDSYVSGMVKMAMYFLNTDIDEYFAFKEYIWDKYGVNVGGAKGDLLEGEKENDNV